MQIVTFLADDDDSEQHDVLYPNLAGVRPVDRSMAYWRCVAAFYATSLRVNPDERHVFYTSHVPGVSPTSRTVLDFLQRRHVEVRHLPFRRFRPPAGLSSRFLNTFYRYDVLHDLITRPVDATTALLDSDCVWIRASGDFEERFNDGRLHTIEVNKHPDPDRVVENGISHRVLGDAFRQIDPGFGVEVPRWYGGELVAGNTSALREFMSRFDRLFQRFLASAEQHDLRVGNSKWLDSDENSSSLVKNQMSAVDEPAFLTRVWTVEQGNHEVAHLSAVVMHMFAEKPRGFRALFPYCLDPASTFWSTPVDAFPEYVGGFFGVPRRLHVFRPTPAEAVTKFVGRLRRFVKRAIARP